MHIGFGADRLQCDQLTIGIGTRTDRICFFERTLFCVKSDVVHRRRSIGRKCFQYGKIRACDKADTAVGCTMCEHRVLIRELSGCLCTAPHKKKSAQENACDSDPH